MWNNGMFNPPWAAPNFHQQQVPQWPVNQQWIPGQPRMPHMQLPGWNQQQQRFPTHPFGQQSHQRPPLPTAPMASVCNISAPQLPPPPKSEKPPLPPSNTVTNDKSEKPQLSESANENKTSNPLNSKSEITKLNLSAPPPPPPPEEEERQSNATGNGKNPSGKDNHQTEPHPENTNTHPNKNSFGYRYDNRGTHWQGRGRASQSFNPRGRGAMVSRGRGHKDSRGNFSRGRQPRFGNNFFHDDNGEYDDGFNSSHGTLKNEASEQESSHDGNLFEKEQSFKPDWKCQNSRGENSNMNSVPDSNAQLENFDKMFHNWEKNFEKWKFDNRNNQDKSYVEQYMTQMDAMRIQMQEKRKALAFRKSYAEHKGEDGQNEASEKEQKMKENWLSESGKVEQSVPFLDNISNKKQDDSAARRLAQKILSENSDETDDEAEPSQQNNKRNMSGGDYQNQDNKRGRWTGDESVGFDVESWRSAPPIENSLGNSNLDSGGGQNYNENVFQRRDNFQSNDRPMFGNSSQGFRNNENNWEGNQGWGNEMGFSRGNFRGRGRFSQNRGNSNNRGSGIWQPTAVTDHSPRQGMPCARRDVFVQREFKPETFDYSHGSRPVQRFQNRGAGAWNQSNEPPQHGQNSLEKPRFHTPPPERSSPVVSSKPSGNNVMIDSLISSPGRSSRPPKIVIVLRGLPGAGKSHLAKLIKEKETEQGGEQPRTMSLDDYFDVDGKYEYDPEMEDIYRKDLVKSFKKNVDGGFFKFLIVDAINSSVDHFNTIWSHAKQNGFEVYVCTVECDLVTAIGRCIHGRKEEDVKEIAKQWEDTPRHMNTLDARGILQDDAIEHVEMEEATDEEIKDDNTSDISQSQEGEEELDGQSFLRASKWEISDKEEKMARLDGTTDKLRSKLAEHKSIEDWLDVGEFNSKSIQQGKKRVRWADIEQRKTQARVKELGFVIGQTNWASKREEDSAASSALASTKIIPNRFQSEFHN